MTVAIRSSEEAVSLEKLVDMQQRLGIQLPNDYQDFLLVHNGGRPRPAVFRFKYESGAYTDSCVDWFLAVYDGEHDNFETYFALYKREKVRLPLELVPIAHDPGGNLICISVSGERKGAVFFWDHEREAENGEMPSYRNVHLIADSFIEFIESLSET